jgi:hypothetical protein
LAIRWRVRSWLSARAFSSYFRLFVFWVDMPSIGMLQCSRFD